jgi:hypothetical protein
VFYRMGEFCIHLRGLQSAETSFDCIYGHTKIMSTGFDWSNLFGEM